MLGGSSSINGMVYVRGHPRDFDHWAEMGADGWAWADVAPYFKRMEHWHGGALRLARHATGRCTSPAARAATRSTTPSSRPARQAGFELTYDYNGAKQEGFGAMEQTVWQGRRWSAANAYLRPALKRRQRQRRLAASPRRVVIADGRATGVEIDARGDAARSSRPAAR